MAKAKRTRKKAGATKRRAGKKAAPKRKRAAKPAAKRVSPKRRAAARKGAATRKRNRAVARARGQAARRTAKRRFTKRSRAAKSGVATRRGRALKIAGVRFVAARHPFTMKGKRVLTTKGRQFASRSGGGGVVRLAAVPRSSSSAADVVFSPTMFSKSPPSKAALQSARNRSLPVGSQLVLLNPKRKSKGKGKGKGSSKKTGTRGGVRTRRAAAKRPGNKVVMKRIRSVEAQVATLKSRYNREVPALQKRVKTLSAPAKLRRLLSGKR